MNKRNGVVTPVKILFLIDELMVGGTETQLILLVENLSRDKFDPVLGILHKSDFSQSLSLTTPIVNFNWSGVPVLKNFQLLKRFRAYLKKERFDIIQTQFVDSEIFGILGTCLCSNKPIVISTRRNLYHWMNDDFWRFRTIRFLNRFVDQIITNSYAVQKKCVDIEGAPQEKITVIPNAVEVEKFQGVNEVEAKKILNVDGSMPVIGVVGNWRPVKGVVCFLQAAQYVHNQIPDAQFVLAGQGAQEEELKTIARDLGVYSNTHFLRSPPHIPTVISALDVAVQSSLSESFSNVLLEYMVAAKPIVATDVGDAAVVIKNNKTGLLVAPGNPRAMSDKILHLLHHKMEARQLGINAKKIVIESYSLESTIDKYEKFYNRSMGIN